MDKKFVTMFIIFVIVFVAFVTLIIFKNPITQLTRAKEDVTPSPEQTLIFAWPQSVPADGSSSSKITVFVRSVNNKPISNRIITLTSTNGTFEQNYLISDEQGQGSFKLTSTKPGVADISAVIDNAISVKNRISVKFL